jgi:hypothetical protein
METPLFRNRLEFLAVILSAVIIALMWLSDAVVTRPQFEIPGGMSDFVNIRLYLQKLAEPELYPRDYLYASTDPARQYTPSYRYLVSALSHFAGDTGNALVLLVPLLAFVYMCSMTLFLRGFTSSLSIAILLAAVSTVPHYSPGGELWGTGGLWAALPRTVFAAVTPLLLMVHLRLRSTARGSALSFALVGLATNLHPITGSILVQILAFERFMAALRRRFPFKGLLAAAACFVLGAAPFMLGFFGIMSKSSTAGAVDPQAFYAAVWARFSHVLLPANRETLWAFAEAFLPLVPFAALGLFSKRPKSPQHETNIRGIVELIGSLLVVVIGGQLVLQWLACSTGWSLMLVDQLRGLRLIYPLVFALAASGLEAICIRLPRRLTAPAALGTALWLLPVLAMPSFAITRDHFPRPLNYLYWTLTGHGDLVRSDLQTPERRPRNTDIRSAAEWANHNTSPEALFLCEDGRFRLFSRRSAAYAFKDGSSCYYLGKKPFLEWARRETAIRKVRESGDLNAWVALARSLGCDYVVVDKETIVHSPISGTIYENGTFAILPVGGGPLQSN